MEKLPEKTTKGKDINMVPEIAPKKFHNEYSQYKPKDSDRVAFFLGKQILSKITEAGVELPKVSEVRAIASDTDKSLLYLFCIDDESVFLWMGEEELAVPGYEKNNLGDVRKAGKELAYLQIFTAWHLNVWYSDNKFCGRCGRPTTIGRKERNILCECGNMIFPKIMPAVIVGVRNGDKILMTRYANREYKGWALIAGFIEIGETAEECVKREVLEEVGIHVDNVTYFTSQPWGIDQDLLLGFYCNAVGKEDIHVDEMELAVGEWVKREDMPVRDDLESLTATMMESFRLGLDKETYRPDAISRVKL